MRTKIVWGGAIHACVLVALGAGTALAQEAVIVERDHRFAMFAVRTETETSVVAEATDVSTLPVFARFGVRGEPAPGTPSLRTTRRTGDRVAGSSLDRSPHAVKVSPGGHRYLGKSRISRGSRCPVRSATLPLLR